MNISVQIPDTVYQRLVSTGSRIQGSIGLVSPDEGNFTAYRRKLPRPGTKYIRLRHGRATVDDTHVRLSLCIDLDEADVVPAQVIEDECYEASTFVDSFYDAQFRVRS